MIYVSYSEGTLPGGFNPEVAAKLNTPEQIATFNADVPGIGETYGEEELTNMEFGWKKTSDDGRFAMTLAMFSMERTDQVYSGFGVIPADLNCDPTGNVPTCTVAFSGNGTSSDIEGLEFDCQLQHLHVLRENESKKFQMVSFELGSLIPPVHKPKILG